MQRSMFTDLYAFTMGAAYVQEGTSEQQVTCEMFVRRLPRNRRFMVASGLQGIATWLSDWRLDSGDIEFLRQLPALRGAMTPAVVDRFRRLRFTGDLWMMPEGTLFFPDQPVLRITAPIIEAQLFETYALSVFNHSASIASKAARVMFAAQGKPVVEFGMRRVNPDASLEASRVAFMMGLEATSNVAAALVHDLPATGTMAHAWVMVHETEDEAFRQFVKTFPKSATMLVDTYDTLEGVKRAIKIAGPALGAIRLDSGDLAELAKGARAILDAAEMRHVKIIASGDLDEHKITVLQQKNAPVDIFAVGTELAASADAPTLGAVYKVVQDAQGRPVAKFATSKGTLGGVHQVFRSLDEQGQLKRDIIGLEHERFEGARPLLEQVMKHGALLRPQPRLVDSRAYASAQLQTVPAHLRALGTEAFEPHSVQVSQAVRDVTEQARLRFAAQA